MSFDEFQSSCKIFQPIESCVRDSLEYRRESLGIIQINDRDIKFEIENVSEILMDENSSNAKSLNTAFLHTYLQHRCVSTGSQCSSNISFHISSFAEPSKIYDMSKNRSHENSSYTNPLSLLNYAQYIIPLSNECKRKVCSETIFRENESKQILARRWQSFENGVNGSNNSEDDFVDSVFIEGNCIANKIADGSILNDSFEGCPNLLDCSPCPDWSDTSSEKEIPIVETENVFKKIDKIIPMNSSATHKHEKIADTENTEPNTPTTPSIKVSCSENKVIADSPEKNNSSRANIEIKFASKSVTLKPREPLKALIPIRDLQIESLNKTPEKAYESALSTRTSTPIRQPNIIPKAASTPVTPHKMSPANVENNGDQSSNSNNGSINSPYTPKICSNTLNSSKTKKAIPGKQLIVPRKISNGFSPRLLKENSSALSSPPSKIMRFSPRFSKESTRTIDSPPSKILRFSPHLSKERACTKTCSISNPISDGMNTAMFPVSSKSTTSFSGTENNVTGSSSSIPVIKHHTFRRNSVSEVTKKTVVGTGDFKLKRRGSFGQKLGLLNNKSVTNLKNIPCSNGNRKLISEK